MANKVFIKSLGVETADRGIEVKNKGVEINVRQLSGDSHIGSLIIRKSGLEWCGGKTRPGNGEKASWDEFIGYMKQEWEE